MPIRSLTSKTNPIIRTIRLVADQSRRAPQDLVLAEGTRALAEALDAKLEIEAVLLSEQFDMSVRNQVLLEEILRSSMSVYRAPDAVFRHLSAVQAPQGILALVRIPVIPLEEVILPDRPLILCACAIQDPGNLGTLIRTADAAGASLVCSLSGTVSARNPKTVRASAGALFRLPVVEQIAAPDFLDYCARRSISLLSSSARGATTYFETDLARPCALLLGNEGSGIDETIWAGVPCVCIPMAPGVESLNVAAAGAILLFEALRQRTMRQRKLNRKDHTDLEKKPS